MHRNPRLWLAISAAVFLVAGGMTGRFINGRLHAADGCEATQRSIRSAILQRAIDTHEPPDGPAPTMSDLVPIYLECAPRCPLGGELILGSPDQDVRCSLHGDLERYDRRQFVVWDILFPHENNHPAPDVMGAEREHDLHQRWIDEELDALQKNADAAATPSPRPADGPVVVFHRIH